MGYAYANQPSTSNYAPEPFWSWHPTGGNISVERIGTGHYVVNWAGVDAEIIGFGNVR